MHTTNYDPMPLTPKQIEIVLHVAAGYTSEQIATKLHVSKLTVDNHRRTALKTSDHVTWNQFMATTGMSGQLKKWKDDYERKNGAIENRKKDSENEAV